MDLTQTENRPQAPHSRPRAAQGQDRTGERPRIGRENLRPLTEMAYERTKIMQSKAIPEHTLNAGHKICLANVQNPEVAA